MNWKLAPTQRPKHFKPLLTLSVPGDQERGESYVDRWNSAEGVAMVNSVANKHSAFTVVFKNSKTLSDSMMLVFGFLNLKNKKNDPKNHHDIMCDNLARSELSLTPWP